MLLLIRFVLFSFLSDQLGLKDSKFIVTISFWTQSLHRISENVVVTTDKDCNKNDCQLFLGSEMVEKLMQSNEATTLLLQLTERKLGIIVAESSIPVNIHEVSACRVYYEKWFTTGFVAGLASLSEAQTFSVSLQITSKATPECNMLSVKCYPSSWYLEQNKGRIYVTVEDINLNEVFTHYFCYS